MIRLTKTGINTRDGVVDFEELMSGNTEGRAESVWHTGIHTADTVSTSWEIATGEQTESRQENTSVVTESKSDLAGVGSLSEGGNTITRNETVVGHGVQGWAHTANISRLWFDIWVKTIVTRDLLEREFLRATQC